MTVLYITAESPIISGDTSINPIVVETTETDTSIDTATSDGPVNSSDIQV